MTNSINLQLEPGQKVTLQPVSWKGFEEILMQLGEFRTSQIAYSNEILEIMAPLPEHERSKGSVKQRSLVGGVRQTLEEFEDFVREIKFPELNYFLYLQKLPLLFEI